MLSPPLDRAVTFNLIADVCSPLIAKTTTSTTGQATTRTTTETSQHIAIRLNQPQHKISPKPTNGLGLELFNVDQLEVHYD
jgi:hypothetical protein